MLWANLSFQDSASPSLEQMSEFHDYTMIIITFIMTMVGVNMIYIIFNKMSDRFLLQEQKIELIWTAAPIMALLLIAFPSLQTLYIIDDPFSPSLTVKATGHQWFWSYEFSDFSDIMYDSYMMPYNDLSFKMRLLETDNPLPLPTKTQIRVITTATDVIHSWTVPSLGVKADAVPGRLNQMMFTLNRSGIFYGQCSEICGANHSFMPIKIEAIPMKSFTQWLKKFNS